MCASDLVFSAAGDAHEAVSAVLVLHTPDLSVIIAGVGGVTSPRENNEGNIIMWLLLED